MDNKLENNMNINNRIENVKTLVGLQDVLNDATDDEILNVDTTSLPVFGGNEIINTEEVYSWDPNSYLYPTDFGWSIGSRCVICGEAICNCQ